MVWVPKPKQTKSKQSNTPKAKHHNYYNNNSQEVVGKECSNECKRVPTQSSTIHSEQLKWVPKIVLSSPTSTSTQQEDTAHTTKQPLGVPKKENVALETKTTNDKSKPTTTGQSKQNDMAKEIIGTGL